MHSNSIRLFETYALRHMQNVNKMLEIGPDPDFTYLSIMNEVGHNPEYWCAGIEPVNHPNFIQFTDPNHIDTQDQFDLVVAGQVMEHVRKPWVWIKELARVLAPNGLLVIITPVSWEYEGATDCWRIHPEGMRSILEEGALTCLEVASESLEGRHCRHLDVTDTIAIARKE